MSTNAVLIEAIIYIGLLVGAIFFVKQSFSEFMEGTTSYSVSHESITLHDIPTLTICFETNVHLFYGQTFFIDVKVSEYGQETRVNLSENSEIQTMYGIAIVVKKITLSTSNRMIPGFCYKITSTWNGVRSVNTSHFQVGFLFNFEKIQAPPATFWITSEDNSYGIVWFRWYDGTVQFEQLENHTLKEYIIKEVTEYQNLRSTCSESSYYKCLANRFTEFDFDKSSGFTDPDGNS